MTKTELIQTVAKKTGQTQSQAGKAVDAVIDSIRESLGAGQDVRLPGFGTFRVTQTKERQGRNLRTGEKMTIPAGKRASFSAGTQLVEAVRGSRGTKK
jgi:DNA-binding protein HU-beta